MSCLVHFAKFALIIKHQIYFGRGSCTDRVLFITVDLCVSSATIVSKIPCPLQYTNLFNSSYDFTRKIFPAFNFFFFFYVCYPSFAPSGILSVLLCVSLDYVFRLISSYLGPFTHFMYQILSIVFRFSLSFLNS